MADYKPNEMMTIAAARALRNSDVCFVGIGMPSAACNLARRGLNSRAPTKLITDLCVFEPDTASKEMTVTSIHPGVTREEIAAKTGWPVRYAAQVAETAPPTATELQVLREVHARTARAH